jgi:hypothetical protein
MGGGAIPSPFVAVLDVNDQGPRRSTCLKDIGHLSLPPSVSALQSCSITFLLHTFPSHAFSCLTPAAADVASMH